MTIEWKRTGPKTATGIGEVATFEIETLDGNPYPEEGVVCGPVVQIRICPWFDRDHAYNYARTIAEAMRSAEISDRLLTECKPRSQT